MNPYTNAALYENISHRTDTAHYSVHYTKATADYEPALYLHWHNEMEFFLLTQGDIQLHIEEQVYTLHAGDGMFIPPGLLHYANNLGGTPPEFYAFVLSPEFLFTSYDTYDYNTYILPVLHNNLSFSGILSADIPWQRDILMYLKNIIYGLDNSALYVRGLSLLIWDKLFHNHIAPATAPKTISARAEQLAPALAYIQENYGQSITLKELSRCAHLSEGQFCRSFKDLTGMTPFHYLIRYRILQSCSELQRTDKKITHIALSCGFNNISYYNRAFLGLMGMTPGEYRKSNNCQFGNLEL